MKVIFALLVLIASTSAQQVTVDLSTALMQSTFRIVGNTGDGRGSLGTAFVIGRRMPKQPERLRYVLVTATHVLNEFTGDKATLFIRHRAPDGRWQQDRLLLDVRVNGRATWVHHPAADVAAMYIALPDGVVPSIIPEDLLSDDKSLNEYEIHPGDELNALGYPLGAEGPGGFPILRSGKIASYPLVPTKDNPFFLMDFRVFKGNSGGPVFLISPNRSYKGATHIGEVHMVMGLVSEEISATEQITAMYENRSQTYPLAIAKIVPAAFILETINMLPVSPSETIVPNSEPSK